MFGDHSHRIASGVAHAHQAAKAVPDDVGHALVVVLLAVLSLIALLVAMAPWSHASKFGGPSGDRCRVRERTLAQGPGSRPKGCRHPPHAGPYVF